MSKKINRWYKMADNYFNLALQENNKTKEEIDFIEMMREHFLKNIKNDKLEYKGKERCICDIKIELANDIYEYEDISKVDNFSFIVILITIFSSMIGSAFLSNKDISIVGKGAIFIIATFVIFILLWGISHLKNLSNHWLMEGKLLSKVCLQLLEDIEKEPHEIKVWQDLTITTKNEKQHKKAEKQVAVTKQKYKNNNKKKQNAKKLRDLIKADKKNKLIIKYVLLCFLLFVIVSFAFAGSIIISKLPQSILYILIICVTIYFLMKIQCFMYNRKNKTVKIIFISMYYSIIPILINVCLLTLFLLEINDLNVGKMTLMLNTTNDKTKLIGIAIYWIVTVATNFLLVGINNKAKENFEHLKVSVYFVGAFYTCLFLLFDLIGYGNYKNMFIGQIVGILFLYGYVDLKFNKNLQDESLQNR